MLKSVFIEYLLAGEESSANLYDCGYCTVPKIWAVINTGLIFDSVHCSTSVLQIAPMISMTV